jgi:hypothetical protein
LSAQISQHAFVRGFFLACGALFLAAGALMVVSTLLTRLWRRTKGRILESSMERWTEIEETGQPVAYFRPAVRFEYRVGEVTYAGSRLSAVDLASANQAWAEGQLARFPVGAEVDVYLNPRDPAAGVLVVRTPGVGVYFLAVGLAMMGAALGLG